MILKSIQYSIWCTGCQDMLDYDEYANKKKAVSYFRSLGWAIKYSNWFCPTCLDIKKVYTWSSPNEGLKIREKSQAVLKKLKEGNVR